MIFFGGGGDLWVFYGFMSKYGCFMSISNFKTNGWGHLISNFQTNDWGPNTKHYLILTSNQAVEHI